MRPDFSSMVTYPGSSIGGDQFWAVCRRYAFVRQFTLGKRVLEVGCGSGLGLGSLARESCLVVGGDITESALRQAQATYLCSDRIRILCFDAHALPFANGSFDAILALATVQYLDIDAFLRECHRVLAHNGVFAFSIPNKDIPGFRPGRFSTRYFSIPELAGIFNRHQFEIEVFGGFSVPEIQERLVQRLIGAAGILLDGLKPSSLIRSWLEDFGRRVIGREVYRLRGELKEEDLEMAGRIPLFALPTSMPNATYRMLYGVARTRLR